MAANKPLGNMIINLSLEGSSFQNSLENIKREVKVAQSAMKANLSVLSDAGDEYETLSTKVKGLSQVMSANEKQIELLSKKHQEAIDTYGKGSKEAQKYAQQINNAITKQGAWSRQLEQSKSRLSELEQGTGGFGNKLKGLGGQFGGLIKSAGLMSTALVGAFTAPIAAIGTLSSKFSAEMSEIQGQIQAMTGVSSKEAKKQGKIVGQVWAGGFGESTDEVGEAVIKIKQNLSGIKDSQLKSVTEKAMTLTKITGADLNESLRGVNSLMTNFGMTANQAFDYMVTGAQRGLNKSGELEDNIAEYGQLWAQNGFSAKDMFSILENGLKSGAYNFDKVNDFVKEFGISLTDGRFAKNIKSFSSGTQDLFNKFKAGKATTKDVFNSAINDLKGMKNQQDKLTIASTVWSSLGEDNAIKVITSLNNTNKAYDNVTGATKKASKALTDTPINQWKQSWREFQVLIKPIGDKLLSLGSNILPRVNGSIKAFLSMMKGDWVGGADILKKMGFSDQSIQTFIVITTKIKSGLNSTVAFIKSKITEIKKFWDQNGSMIMQAVQNVLKFLVPLIKSILTNVKNIISGALTVILGLLKIFGGLFTGNWSKVWEGIKDIFSGAFKVLLNALELGLFGKILKGAKAFAGLFKPIFSKLWSALKTVFSTPIKWIVNLVSKEWGSLTKFSNSLSSGLKNLFTKMWDSLKNIFKNPIKWIVDHFNSLKSSSLKIFDNLRSGASKIWTNMISTVKKLPGKMADGIKSGAGKLKSAMTSIGNAMLKGLEKGVNGVTGGINWILEKVHAPKSLRIPKWKVPQYAKGTGDHPGGFAVVSDGKGKNKQELITLPNGQSFLSPNKETVLNLPKGTSVLNGDATAQLLNILPKYASGKGWLQNAWDSVKSVGSKLVNGTKSVAKKAVSKVADVWEYASHPGKLINLAVDKFTDLGGLENPILGMVKGTISTVKSGAVNWIKKQLDFAGNPSGSGVKRWKPYVERALAMNDLSTSASMVNKVLRQIATESGGNPKAVQHGYTDINTKTGDLAKGLMQTISATFNAYKFPGHDDIFNGFDNLLAALNYAKHRYGKNLSGLGEGHGYANGGIVTKAQLANIAEGNKPEAIIPLDKAKRSRAMQILSATQKLLGVPSSGTVINDNSDVIARQDQQITLMQSMIELLIKLVSKDTSFNVDGKELAGVLYGHTETLMSNQLSLAKIYGGRK
ncbi:phage tail tape measure protein [Heyndrickxia ginsengihumi]|uniref:phage tail tape measure protein n=1 Tax=Heyndrickxia ginsengihumi TaxID=363870 RepID=UPI00046FE17B|nr:phage tail tape measure protein [Heyndrickxia ginsengihumi]